MTESQPTLRAYRAGDESTLIAGCRSVLARRESFPLAPHDEASWRWKYLENPAGHAIVLAEDATGRAVSHYAGLPLRLLAFGAERRAALVTDSWTLAEARSFEQSTFVELAELWAAMHAGSDEAVIGLAFGVPSPRSWRVGRARLGYDMLRDVNLLVHEGPFPNLASARGALVVEEVTAIDFPVDDLWARFAGTVGFATIRDAAYLTWRYLRRPERAYRVWAAREGAQGTLRGLMVTARGTIGRFTGEVLVDWFVPSWDHEAGDLLMDRLHRCASECEPRRSVVLFPSPYEWHLRLQRWGYRVHTTDDFVAARIFAPGWDLPMLRNTWLYSAGDLWLI